MNIYIHIEIESRELDSKLLLAILAAIKGHQVIISDMSGIERGFRSKFLAPGIFHTKSLTPSEAKIKAHQTMIDKGSLITSIDEEGGLVNTGYENFAKRRYSNHSIGMSSATFSWGEEDTETLKKFYPKHSSKIHMTGSPRVDLWKTRFSKFWSLPSSRIPKKPYLLVIGNMSAVNAYMPFYERFKNARDAGYFKRDPEMLRTLFIRGSEHFLLTHEYIQAIQHLNKHNNGFDIIFRPHPVEDIESWKTYFEEMSNVYVTREGPVNAWINNAFAVMHNGCTTAYEAKVSKKQLITYVPIERETDNLPNKFGYLVKTKEDLLSKVNVLLDNSKFGDQKNLAEQLPQQLLRKIFIDDNELSAEKIIKIWETLDNNNLSKKSNIKMFIWFLKIIELRDKIGFILKNFFPNKFERFRVDRKFPPFEKKDIQQRINKLCDILKIRKQLDCKLISQRIILIKEI
jgi:surface carbohydrate biosynthesis protein